MFDKIKQLMELREQAQRIKSGLANEKVTAESMSGQIKIEMDGNQKLQSVEISPELLAAGVKTALESGIREATNTAIKKSQQLMAKKMQSMTGLNIPGL